MSRTTVWNAPRDETAASSRVSAVPEPMTARVTGPAPVGGVESPASEKPGLRDRAQAVVIAYEKVPVGAGGS